MKYFAVGDIHGNLKALQQVLERSEFNREEDTLLCVGDYTDGNDESAEVVQLLIELPNFIGVRGNHDVWAEKWLEYGHAPEIWVQQGGKETIESYKRNPELMTGKGREEHVRFFKNLHNYYFLDIKIDEDKYKHYAFVHGGWTDTFGLGNEDFTSDYHWDRELWASSTMESLHSYVDDRWKWYAEPEYVFIGHTATDYGPLKDAPLPVSGYNGKLINLDQGAGWSGKLTICNIETQEYWQSDTAKELYGKAGR